MNLFKNKYQPLLGIDISASSVKLVELVRIGDLYHLSRMATVLLPTGAVVDKHIVDKDAVVDALKKAVKLSKTKLKNACIAVPSANVITRTFLIPKDVSDSEMEDRIILEAEQYIPYSIDEVSLDFCVLGENIDSSSDNNVMLVASRQDGVDQRIEVITNAGLIAKVVDVEQFAIENALNLIKDQIPQSHDLVLAMVDIGATTISLTVIENGRTIYNREQGGGGRQLTSEIEKKFGLPFEEAELVKKLGGLPDNYANDVLEPFKNTIIQNISRSMQFFMSSSANKRIDCIALMGGGSSIQGLAKKTESMLGINAFVVNPFINMHVSKKLKTNDVSNDAPAYLIACGLALREVK